MPVHFGSLCYLHRLRDATTSFSRLQNLPRGSTNLEKTENPLRVAARLDETATPELMRHCDIPKACETVERAAPEDPMQIYFQVTPHSKRYKAGARLVFSLQFYRGILEKGSWTVDHGQAVAIISDPERQREPIVKILDPLLKWLILGIRRLSESREQRKRVEEHTTKSRKALRENLGERLEQMMEVSWLITAPEYRKGGYATALVHVATDLADARGVSVWLASSNPVNEGFYNDLGFQTVGTFHLGTDNPSWKGPPVSIEIMVREPKRPRAMMREKRAGLT